MSRVTDVTDVSVEVIDDAVALSASVISAVAWEGLRVETADGRPATLAIVDADGNVLESGERVLAEAFNVAVMAYRRLLIGKGYLRVYSTPTGLFQDGEH